MVDEPASSKLEISGEHEAAEPAKLAMRVPAARLEFDNSRNNIVNFRSMQRSPRSRHKPRS